MMNYLAHAHRFFQSPAFALGTLLPDFLNMVDRRARARRKRAQEFLNASRPFLAQLAAGVIQHHRDDETFHNNPTFLLLQAHSGRHLRDHYPDPRGMRSWFAAHIGIEMLLDWTITQELPTALEQLYAMVADVDVANFQADVELLTSRPLPSFPQRLELFLHERFLYDYAHDERLLYRLNRILQRVGLEPFPAAAVEWVAAARVDVWEQRSALLVAGPVDSEN